MHLLLFDVDGVLIEPHGYHRALQDTLQKLGELCGLPNARLSEEDIAAFESCGVSSEWDSAAISLAYMLKQIWRSAPGFRLPERLAAAPPPFSLPAPRFSELTSALAASRGNQRMPLERGAQLLLNDNALSGAQQAYLREILAQARSAPSASFLIFQELVAGSAAFTQLYRLPPALQVESYLKHYDRPNLPPADAAALLSWCQASNQGAALFTARPGSAPAPVVSAPDAESGAELLGLTGIPSASQGKITWVGQQLRLPEQALIKPAPAHVLLALLLAAGLPLEQTLPPLKAFLLNESAPRELRDLHGARVCIFEDSSSGIQSLQNAAERLARMGIDLQVQIYGISEHPAKIAALQSLGAQVYANIHSALAACGVL